MNDTQKQIIRQSSLKSSIEFFKVRTDYKPTLMEIIGVSMGMEAYAMDGSYELLQTIQKKLDKNQDIWNIFRILVI